MLFRSSLSPHPAGFKRPLKACRSAFYAKACELGIVSKRADAPYALGDRGLWLKTKCLHCEEFGVVGWTDPEGARGRGSVPCSSRTMIL